MWKIEQKEKSTLCLVNHHSSPPYGPWQTLSVLRPTLRVVQLHDILQVQHQFLEIFESVLGFSFKGKNTKNDYHFLGEGGVRAKSDKNHFFGPFKIF